MEVLRVMILPSGQCDKCGNTVSVLLSCPDCKKKFCAGCLIYNPAGKGDYVICPDCGMKLYFPEKVNTAA